MTKEKILEMVLAINAHGTYGTEFLDTAKFDELVDALKADIRDENNKKCGKSKPAKLGKAILARGQKMQKNTSRTELMAYAYTADNGIKWCVDGYRLVGFFEDVDLPELPEEDRCRWFKLEKIVENDYDDEELETPTIGELKAGIKIAKSEKKLPLVVLNHGICVNAQYLLDFLEGLENPHVYAYVTNGKVTRKSPIRIEADNGIGVLLPVSNDTFSEKEPGIYSV